MTRTMEWIDGLNPEQKQAVQHVEGPMLVLAGAGSGKTRVLTTRIAWLIEEHGVDPAGVLAVTFTNKAAAEMRARLRRLLGRDPAGAWVGTFHAIGARILRHHAPRVNRDRAFTIYDADDAAREVKRAIEALDLPVKRWPPKSVAAAISAAKNRFISAPKFAAEASDPFHRTIAAVYTRYQTALDEQNACDFDDLLVKPVELFLREPSVRQSYAERFRFILVDEYQDTNHVQYRFLELLARPPGMGDERAFGSGNLMVVGDDDQAIYGWRGADIRNILDFEQDFPDAYLVRLERNYRSTATILAAANRVIACNVMRKGKTLRTEIGAGEPLTRVEARDERDEADWIAGEIQARLALGSGARLRDHVVLYRTNAQSRALEEAMRRRDLPYQIVGGTRFYERREIMDVLAYLRLISNPRDAAAFERIVNYPRRGIGDTSRGRLLAWAAEHAVSPLSAAERAAECEALGRAAAAALQRFGASIAALRGEAAGASVAVLLERIVDGHGIADALREEGPEGEDRLENVAELIASAHEFDARVEEVRIEEGQPETSALDLFLQKIALVTDVDRHDPEADAVTLMTLHNAKGLEFPVVFISGLEDGLFPLARSLEERDGLEEERRLFYVGITRAKRKVFLTHARTRRRAGGVLGCLPSGFLDALPGALVERRVTPSLARDRFPDSRARRFASAGFDGGAQDAEEVDRGGDYTVDYSDSQDLPRFVKGERVQHPRFGAGVIRALSGFGRDLQAVIDFESVGRKKVLIRYANLQRDA